jgi:hypothetical protein
MEAISRVVLNEPAVPAVIEPEFQLASDFAAASKSRRDFPGHRGSTQPTHHKREFASPQCRVARQKPSAHSLRSGWIATAAARGASIFKLKEVSRHKSTDVLAGYVWSQSLFSGHAGEGLL